MFLAATVLYINGKVEAQYGLLDNLDLAIDISNTLVIGTSIKYNYYSTNRINLAIRPSVQYKSSNASKFMPQFQLLSSIKTMGTGKIHLNSQINFINSNTSDLLTSFTLGYSCGSKNRYKFGLNLNKITHEVYTHYDSYVHPISISFGLLL